jgi:hypothetical protein
MEKEETERSVENEKEMKNKERKGQKTRKIKIYEKLWEELITYFCSIRHGRHTKRRVEQISR